jgi:hypothetical protein
MLTPHTTHGRSEVYTESLNRKEHLKDLDVDGRYY